MDFAAARTKMVDNQIRTTDVTDWRILGAFLQTPREVFVPEGRRELAYIGGDVPLKRGRALMAASPFAKLLQLAEVREGDTVLDVGCGTGYSSAVLSRLAGRVVALESDPDLAAAGKDALASAGAVGCSLVEGPLQDGLAGEGPFDRILFEGSVEAVPDVFFDQLREGGRLVAVEGRGNAAVARLYLKEEGVVSSRFAFNCSIPELPGFVRPAHFVF